MFFKEIVFIKWIKNRWSEVIMVDCYKICLIILGYMVVMDESGNIMEVLEVGFYFFG